MPWEIDSRIGEKLKYEPPRLYPKIVHVLVSALEGMTRTHGLDGVPQEEKDAAFDAAFSAIAMVHNGDGGSLDWRPLEGAPKLQQEMGNYGGRAETLKDATASDTPPLQADGPDNDAMEIFPDYIDLFRIIRRSGKSDAEKAKAVNMALSPARIAFEEMYDDLKLARVQLEAANDRVDWWRNYADGLEYKDEQPTPFSGDENMSMPASGTLVENLERLMMWCQTQDPNATIWLHLVDAMRVVEAVAGIDDDYMTSEAHHPGYVLIPTAKFERLKACIGGDKS